MWIALPHEQKDIDPDFAHYDDLPVITDVRFAEAGQITLPGSEGFEYGPGD
jgi:redox-sensitive bicupin YhaK (pirin superfamily)